MFVSTTKLKISTVEGCNAARSVYQKVSFTKKVGVVCLTEFCFISLPSIVQVVLSTAHPTKFSEAVTKALSISRGFEFERDESCWKWREESQI